MKLKVRMTNYSLSTLESRLQKQYGPTIGGNDLYQALGFRTYASFYRSQKIGMLGIHVFKITGRRGWFAATSDVAEWLDKQSSKNANLKKGE